MVDRGGGKAAGDPLDYVRFEGIILALLLCVGINGERCLDCLDDLVVHYSKIARPFEFQREMNVPQLLEIAIGDVSRHSFYGILGNFLEQCIYDRVLGAPKGQQAPTRLDALFHREVIDLKCIS